jgi:SAM-dependent methyltransferase
MPEEHIARLRNRLSKRYLRGEGIEIGALHFPLWTSQRATVRYVDRLDTEGLRRHYPELDAQPLVPVHIVDDGERLHTIAPDSLDFIIANHMLEHCENPLGSLRTHLSRLKPGGFLYYAVPDKRKTFDIDRPLTPFDHLVRDDQAGPEVSRADHFYEWIKLVNKRSTREEIEAEFQHLTEINYSIHFHVWDRDSYLEFLARARDYLPGSFEAVHVEPNDFEIISVLRKAGGPPEDRRSLRARIRALFNR